MCNNQQRYIGFLNTPHLWKNVPIKGLQQFSMVPTQIPFHTVVAKNMRLGKLVERFVSQQLQHDSRLKLLAENLIISKNKRTIGELDCLFTKDGQPYHLEVVYKFYLYDSSVGTSEIDHWIGPNRKDSFTEKLDKLKTKQLPLLYRDETKPTLKQFNLEANHIKQCVCFKAQLFIPYGLKNHTFKHINPNCIVGYYYKLKEVSQLTHCKFFIPKKLDWLSKIDIQINWLTFKEFTPLLQVLLEQKRAPMVWIKTPKGHTKKGFVVWW
ncbi:hypothetical protein IA57_12550 [Mangrovimonas yunxiaonensis]|uniref:DUF1853 domain-containing protein n=1 Tax=Mangrovimonas yunxiaonensis TaxID=1197477 RepID=A0A084THQ6_9FLAO|nr:DUF1853 family protein [Mangrovimonas yunxiaonensis]KFB00242.1 hypothetical protein IA57_12550 [Mangrovimonas yunxiaonensis]GGH42800.1 hypothetical protein GCM10011364_14570 [Mangrovimonas yunxiaonensis]